ncbi:heparinase, partial [Rhizobium sp. BUS002]|nr:heparinase [Rhizobium phaseoli]
VDRWLSIPAGRRVGMAWDTDVTAQRGIAWLSHSPVVLQTADRGFCRRFLKSLAFLVRFLHRMAPCTLGGVELCRLR